jgi:HK97 family phage major capsid protein
MSDDNGVTILDELRDKDASTLDEGTPDELRGKTPDELAKYVEVLDAHLRSIHQTDEGELREKTAEEQAAFNYGLRLRDLAITKVEEHRKIQEIFRRKPKAVERALARINYGDDMLGDVRRMSTAEARDAALRQVENRVATMHLTDNQKAQIQRKIRRDTDVARRLLVTENDDYRSAFVKLVTDTHPFLTQDEHRAVQAFKEYRAMAEGTGSTGGFGIPVFIDPSIILTDQESGNPFLTLARQVTVTTNAWKGVSAAGVSWSFDPEASEVSDDDVTLAQPEVDVHTARGFIPYSIEVGDDYPMFADEMSRLLGAGYDELLVDKFSRGSGAGEPDGILTALDRSTSGAEVLLTTAGTLGDIDVYNVWSRLPAKYRRRAAWMMSIDVNTAIQRFGTADAWHAVTRQLPDPAIDVLRGKLVYESSYFPDFDATTGHQNVLVVGDWQNYVVARRSGMTVELVPHLFGTTNGLPTGQRGWFAWARIGGGASNTAGFRLLNQT